MSEVKYIVEYRDKTVPGGWVKSYACGESFTIEGAIQNWRACKVKGRYRIVEIRTVRTVVKESE